jgi:hypothetical protein
MGDLARGEIQKAPPSAPPEAEIRVLKSTLAVALNEIQNKTSKMSAHDLRRILFRCASVLLTFPSVCIMTAIDPEGTDVICPTVRL